MTLVAASDPSGKANSLLHRASGGFPPRRERLATLLRVPVDVVMGAQPVLPEGEFPRRLRDLGAGPLPPADVVHAGEDPVACGLQFERLDAHLIPRCGPALEQPAILGAAAIGAALEVRRRDENLHLGVE